MVIIHDRIYRAVENNIKAKWRVKMQERGGPNYMLDVYLTVTRKIRMPVDNTALRLRRNLEILMINEEFE